MDQAKILGLRESIPYSKTVKVNRSISAVEKKLSPTIRIPQGRKRASSTADSSLITSIKPQGSNLNHSGSEITINELQIFQPRNRSLSPIVSELSIDKLGKIQALKPRDCGPNPCVSEVSINRLQIKQNNVHMAVAVKKYPLRSGLGSQQDRFGLIRRSSKKNLVGTGKWMWTKSEKNIFNSRYFWTYMAIDKLVNGAIIAYLIYYIRILLHQLNDGERNITWWQWFLNKLCDKVGAFELISFVVVIVLTKLGLRGLDIVLKRLEFLHEEKQEENNQIFQERMKKIRNKFKTEKWKTVTEGLTTLLSNIVTTVVNAFVPTEAASRIVISVVDTADKALIFNRRARKSASPTTTSVPSSSGYNPNFEANNLSNLSKLSTKNNNSINTNGNMNIIGKDNSSRVNSNSPNPYTNSSYNENFNANENGNKPKKSPSNKGSRNTAIKGDIDFEF